MNEGFVMMLTAHSGCDGTEPNSRAFLEYALNSPADAVEVDVRLYEGSLVLSHDAPGIPPMPLREAFSLLAAYPGKKMNCDLKQQNLEIPVYQAAQEIGVEKQLIYTGEVSPAFFAGNGSLSGKVLWFANMECLEPDIQCRLQQLAGEERRSFLQSLLERVREIGAEGLNWDYREAEKVWRQARQMGIGLSVWTVDEPETLGVWLERMPENLTTNRVRLACSLRDSCLGGNG